MKKPYTNLKLSFRNSFQKFKARSKKFTGLRLKKYKKHTLELFFSTISKVENNILLFFFKRKLLFLINKIESRKKLRGIGIYFYDFKVIGLPSKSRKIMLFKSPHVHKKAKILFKQNKNKSLIKI